MRLDPRPATSEASRRTSKGLKFHNMLPVAMKRRAVGKRLFDVEGASELVTAEWEMVAVRSDAT